MPRISVLFISVSLFFFLGCDEKAVESIKQEVPELDDISTIDSLFSDMSEKQGMKAAFLHYMEDDGVIIRPNSNPIAGADAVAFLSDLNDSDFKMSWKAEKTEAGAANDLAYAFGRYNITSTRVDSTLSGSYVHVWRKLQDGSWKIVLNSWNEASDF